MTHFQAYLLTRLDGLNHYATVFTVLAFIISFLSSLAFVLSHDSFICKDIENTKRFGKIAIISLCIGLFFSLIKLLTPTTKEAAFIYIAPAIVNNQNVQETFKKLPELSSLGLEYLGGILKEEIGEGKKEIKESLKK